VCAVVADGTGFDLAATRRLQLAAGDALLLVACARPAGRVAPPSACTTRWRVQRVAGQSSSRVQASSSAARFRARLPSEPHWRLTLERAKIAQAVPAASATPAAPATKTAAPVAAASAVGAEATADRAWEWQGAEDAPRALVAAATRRAVRAAERLHARTATRMAERGCAGDAMHTSPDPVPPAASMPHPRARVA
jgi:hypothetical protein